ncbi:metal ABC transporter permease [bacterium]|nr:metal ABC transporter permease [bacterium]
MEILKYSFFINALISGILVGILGTIFSFFIITKKISFFPVGIAHSAFGGIALGIFLGLSPELFGMIFSVLMGLVLTYLYFKNRADINTLVGILFPFSMAIGIFLISLNKRISVDVFSFLFGNILSITTSDVLLYGLFFIIEILFFIFFFKRLIYIDFDMTDAQINNVNIKLYEYFFNGFLALTIMISLKLLGIILVSSLFIIPGAIIVNLKANYKKGIFYIILLSVSVIIGSLFISYNFKIPPGPTIIILYSIIYFVFYLSKKSNVH